MLQNKRQNFHHSKLPEIGAIVEIHTGESNFSKRYKKFIVESFNLCDNVLPYSFGIHLVNVVSLDNRNNRYTVSGHLCEVIG